MALYINYRDSRHSISRQVLINRLCSEFRLRQLSHDNSRARRNSGICTIDIRHLLSMHVHTILQGVVTYAMPVEAFATGIKIGSNDQRDISDRSSDHSHFHERSRIKKGSIQSVP